MDEHQLNWVTSVFFLIEKDIESSSKLRTNVLVKKYFCVELYILHIRGNHLITVMARYRIVSK